jgi:hypothetical protein
VQVWRLSSSSPKNRLDRCNIEWEWRVSNLIERLIAAHRILNRDIRRELAHRVPDPLRLAELKKRRLAIKDRLFRHFPDAAEMRRLARGAIRRARHA